jgi:hypothetical protein
MHSEMYDGRENVSLRINLSDAEKSEKREDYFANIGHIMELDEQIKELQKSKKAYSEQNQELHAEVTRGFNDIKGDYYYNDDHDTNMRTYFNETGEVLHERKLKPSEARIQFPKVHNL